MKRLLMTILATTLAALVGCSSGESETATAHIQTAGVADGDFLLYDVKMPQGNLDAKVVLRTAADGYVMHMPVALDEPESGEDTVDRDDIDDSVRLDRSLHPRDESEIDAYFIERLWVDPDHATQRRQKWGNYDAFAIEAQGDEKGERYYDVNTGFLVGYDLKVGFATIRATLIEASIDGLE